MSYELILLVLISYSDFSCAIEIYWSDSDCRLLDCCMVIFRDYGLLCIIILSSACLFKFLVEPPGNFFTLIIGFFFFLVCCKLNLPLLSSAQEDRCVSWSRIISRIPLLGSSPSLELEITYPWIIFMEGVRRISWSAVPSSYSYYIRDSWEFCRPIYFGFIGSLE